MSKFSNYAQHYISGVDTALERSLDALRAIDQDHANTEYITILVRGIIHSVPDDFIKELRDPILGWLKEKGIL